MPQETYGVIIHQIHNTIEKSLNNQLRRKGITLSQMNVLITLVASPKKKLSFKELEKRLTLAQSTTVGLISRLEQKKLVSVFGDKEDKRICFSFFFKFISERQINQGAGHYNRAAVRECLKTFLVVVSADT